MKKVNINISIDQELLSEIDRFVEMFEGVNRSKLICYVLNNFLKCSKWLRTQGPNHGEKER